MGHHWLTSSPIHPTSVQLPAVLSSANDFGLFLSDEDPKKGIWLEAGKALDYYMLRNGVSASLRWGFLVSQDSTE